MSVHERETRRGSSRVLGLLSVLTWCAGTACSGEKDGPAVVSSPNRPSPPASADANAASGETPVSETATAVPNGSAAEGSPVPGLVSAPSGSPAAADEAEVAGADGGAASVPAPACARAVTDANKEVVSAAIEQLFVRGDIAAVDRYWGEPYLQHNPIAASGVVAFRNLFSGLISPGNSIYDLSRVLGQCELVVIHGDYTSFGGPTFDMFRVQEGRVVEHWDGFASGAGPNPSGHTALDGPSVVQDVELTGQNQALVARFVESVLINQAYDTIGEYMSPELIEHDPQGVDGSDAFVESLQTQQLSYRQVRHQIADGNFVFLLSEGAVGTTQVAHYDLFRVEGARIVEHWNGRRDVPATSQSGLGIF